MTTVRARLAAGTDPDAADEDGNAYVYDNCNVVRRKCSRFLAAGLTTKTAWLKAMGVNPNSFNTFMSFNGKGAGARMPPRFWDPVKLHPASFFE